VVAGSHGMQEVLATLERLAPTELTVTLIGETGTGKDVLAHTLHDYSARSEGPFVVFDCGAVAASLAESELFGHERGAFTGAHSSHPGAFERAHGGTLFLDEVGELPLELQPRLLRALENRGVRRVGGTEYRPVDLRVVAATNRDLREQVAAGSFRKDLYFRLAAAVVSVPLLADLGRDDIVVPQKTYDVLRTHSWPGNVRELKNTLASAVPFVDAAVLEPSHLRFLAPEAVEESALDRLPLGGQPLERLERAAIKQTLAQMRGNKAHTAQALGIAVSTLYEKLKKYRF
jgi:two-component system, NtrC family, response regulator AtoC